MGISIVAERLRQTRLRVGISQKQLGIQAGVDVFSASTRINNYERGRHTPDLYTLSRLAAVLRVPAPYFYCQDEELAAVILRFSALEPAQKRRLLDLLDQL